MTFSIKRISFAMVDSYKTHMIKSNYVWLHIQTSNIRRNLVGNQIVGHSNVVGASPVGAAPTSS